MLDATQVLAWAGLILGGGGGVYALVNTLLNKKLRTPSDRQAEVEFGVKLLQDQISKADRDADRWLKMEEYLRSQLDKADNRDSTQRDEIEELASLLRDARDQIRELSQERDDLHRRLSNLAAKHTKGEPITLADIIGTEAAAEVNKEPNPTLDFEDTQIPTR